MKRLSLLTALLFIVLASLTACKKIPSRSHIEINLVSINNNEAIVSQGIELDYNQIHTFKYYYKSEDELDIIHIQLVKNSNTKIDGVDEKRITQMPTNKSKSGHFIYTLNAKEQCDPPSTGPLSKFEFIKVVFINKLGVVAEHTVQFKII